MSVRSVSGTSVAVSLVSLAVLIAAFGPLSGFLSRTDNSTHSQLLVFTVIGAVFTATGAFVVWRTGNRVGWVLLGIGVCLSMLWIGVVLHDHQAAGAEVGAPALLITVWIGFAWVPALFLLAVLLPLLFPTGRPPGPVWRWVAVVAGVGMIGGLIGASVEALTLPGEQVLGDDSSTWWIINATLVVGIVGAAASVVVRMRRATVVERQQIKWVVLSLGIVASLVLLAFTPAGVLFLGDNPAVQNLFLLTFSLIPLSIVAAISRYRLYDVDRIISRTVSYAVVVGLLASVYAGVVFVLGNLFQGEGSLAVAASTLAVAALFDPLRKRVQTIIDRRFNRTRYDTQKVMGAFVDTLRDRVTQQAVVEGWIGVVDQTMQPAAIGLWLRA